MPDRFHRALLLWAGALVAICPGSAAAQRVSQPPSQDLSRLSLEELTHIDVSSVSRKSQDLFKTPAAVFVITREEIRTSGANSLPELLRMVPGMQVAQIDANTWAISARGFNSRYADKMLVLMDGRSIYSEIYSGVFWDRNDVSLADIDRIEVIRGPGGTLWGANAVNGVIDIITLPAKRTLGTKLVALGGNMENGFSLRHGAGIGSRFRYRGFVKLLRRNALQSDQGDSSDDEGHSLATGARADLQATANDLFTFHGGFTAGTENQCVNAYDAASGARHSPDSVSILGGYALARWEHRFSGSELALQTFYSDEHRAESAGAGREHFLDFDFQHHLPSFHRNDVVWGLGYRLDTDRIFGTPATFSSDHHRDALYNLFFQDDFALIPRKLVATGGVKLQHNSYTGFEFQPSVRVLFTPDNRHSLWAAVSRAVRTPSVQDRDLHFFQALPPENGLPTQVLALGNPAFMSEIVMAYEAGYRQSLGPTASLDVASFFNRYTNLRDRGMLAPSVVPGPVPTLVIPIQYNNDLDARTRGVEVAASWNPLHSLHLRTSYTWMNGSIYRFYDGARVTTGDTWFAPTNTLNFRSAWSVTRHWTLNSALYSVSRLERASPNGIDPARAFVRLDQHVSFNFFESLTFTAGINNMLQSRHPEFDPTDGYTVRSQIPRSAFLKALWSF
jgi:iron complex outermembrane receptor protein